MSAAATEARLAAQSLYVPVGTIIAYAGQTPPAVSAGWLPCDGAPYQSAQYSELFAAIGTAFGGGGGSFNAPLLAGLFLRGVTGQRASGPDPDVALRSALQYGGNTGNAAGSYQTYGTVTPNSPFQVSYRTKGRTSDDKEKGITDCSSGSDNNTPSVTGGDLESRPVNKYVTFLVKASMLTSGQTRVILPLGTILSYSGWSSGAFSHAPWILCDGSALAGQTYADLSTAFAGVHGRNSDGTALLPDYRGYFLRGVTGASTIHPDPQAAGRTAPYAGSGGQSAPGNSGNAVGSVQGGATGLPVKQAFTASIPRQVNGSDDKRGSGATGQDIVIWDDAVLALQFAGGDKESRPANLNVDWMANYAAPTGQSDGLPAGTIIAYAGDPAQATANGPFLLCDGTTCNQSTYPDLFAAIGNLYGGSRTGGTFAVPDARGYFLRGADRGTNVDPDATSRVLAPGGTQPSGYTVNQAGSFQGSATALPKTNPFTASVGNMILNWHSSLGATTSSPSPNSASTSNVSLTGGDGDTRPANVYVHYLIKHSNA